MNETTPCVSMLRGGRSRCCGRGALVVIHVRDDFRERADGPQLALGPTRRDQSTIGSTT